MAVLKPRNRILIFRLTQDEYENLQTACTDKGARSLSDFARTQLLGAIGAETKPPDVAQFDEKLSELRAAVDRIAQLLEK